MFGRCIQILVIIGILLYVSLEQRGGGGGSRSSSRSSRSYSSGRRRRNSWSGFSFWGANNDTATNSTVDQDGLQDGSGSSWKWTAGFLGAFGILAYIGNNSQKKKDQERRQKINKIFDNFEAQAQATMCTLNDTQKANARDWFMGNKWKILFKTSNGTFRDTADVTLVDIKGKLSYSYKFSMTMSDSIGSSKSQGILIHQSDYFAIYFEKTYNDRSNAGQTGTFDLLIYEGIQQGEVFRGKWYYKGYQSSLDYSGTWEMIHS